MKNNIIIVLAIIIILQLYHFNNQPSGGALSINAKSSPPQLRYQLEPTFTPSATATEILQLSLAATANAQIAQNPPTAIKIITATPLPPTKIAQRSIEPFYTPTAIPVVARLAGSSSYGINNHGLSIFDMEGTKAGLLLFGNHNLNGNGITCLSAFPHGDLVAVGQDETLKIIANDNSSGYDIIVPKLRHGCVSHPDGLFVAANTERGVIIVPRKELGFIDDFWRVGAGFDSADVHVVGWAGDLLILNDEQGRQWIYNAKMPRTPAIQSSQHFEKILSMYETWVLPYSNR